MVNYQEERAKLTNAQLNKLKSAAKNRIRLNKKIRFNKKDFENEELPRELIIATRQTMKICNAITRNMSTDIKFSKDQILKFSHESVTVL